MDLNKLSVRELQIESAKALSTMQATSNNIWRFNKVANHDSHAWYKAVIEWYIKQYGDLPSKIGPGKDVRLLLND